MMETMQTTTNTNSTAVGIGARLKAAREQLKMSEKEAASRLHLSVKFITLMENEDFHNDTPVTFLKGYLRSYGRILSISDKEIADAIDQLGIHTTTSKPLSSRMNTPVSNDSERYVKWITYLISFVLIILVGMWWSSRTKDNEANKNINSTTNLPENSTAVTEPAMNNTPTTDVDSDQDAASTPTDITSEKNNTPLLPNNKSSLTKNQANKVAPTHGPTKSASENSVTDSLDATHPSKNLETVITPSTDLPAQASNALSSAPSNSDSALPNDSETPTATLSDENTDASITPNVNEDADTMEPKSAKKINRHQSARINMAVPEPGLDTNDF